MFNAALHREMMFGSGSTMKSYGFDIPKSADKFDWAGHHAKTQEYLTRLNGCVRVLHLINQIQAHWLHPSPLALPGQRSSRMRLCANVGTKYQSRPTP